MADDFDYSMFDNYGTDDEPFYDFELDYLLGTSGPSSGGPADAGFDYGMFDNYGTDNDPFYDFELDDLLGTSGPSSGGPADAGFDYGMFDNKKDDKNFLEKMFGGVGSALGGVGSALGLGGGGSKNNTLATLLALGGASFAKDRGYLDKDIPVVGYQGKIPKYQYVQEQVTGRDDSDRRPGSAGRRYMSDGIYAKAPENQQPMSVAEAKAKAKAQAQGFAEGGDVAAFLQGIGMAEGGYLNGDSDGQADKVPGSIDGVQEAKLSHGEYVLPADLVSLLGNGNSDAGAKALDDFMAMVRKQGTGTEKQQKNIKADKVLASLMQGKG